MLHSFYLRPTVPETCMDKVKFCKTTYFAKDANTNQAEEVAVVAIIISCIVSLNRFFDM